jgi:ADP-heptose:LPS heptosyltransferase
LSASTSCSSRAATALALIREGEQLPEPIVHALGEECPAEFFRTIVEALSDSFDPDQAAAYEQLMTAWIPPRARVQPRLPERVDKVYVLSRVTLGADIKITSLVLDAMKRRFPEAEVHFVGNRKSTELFAADRRVVPFEAQYPRSGPVSERLKFAKDLSERIADSAASIVIDPDSRMTQLGLVPVGPIEHYFHFPSRVAGSASNLTDLTRNWVKSTFGVEAEAYIAPEAVDPGVAGSFAAVSLGTGENDTKRLTDSFEWRLIELLGQRFDTIRIDRGAGGEEARRVTAAVEKSGAGHKVRFWEGSFAGFASLIGQAAFYAGYDSAGQHAAAASGTPLVTIFAGALSERFRERWSPSGRGEIQVINADEITPGDVLERITCLRP